jgi:hypothetical protein
MMSQMPSCHKNRTRSQLSGTRCRTRSVSYFFVYVNDDECVDLLWEPWLVRRSLTAKEEHALVTSCRYSTAGAMQPLNATRSRINANHTFYVLRRALLREKLRWASFGDHDLIRKATKGKLLPWRLHSKKMIIPYALPPAHNKRLAAIINIDFTGSIR